MIESQLVTLQLMLESTIIEKSDSHLAMAPTQSAKDITALIQEINSTAAQVSGSAQDNDEARKTLWSAAQKLFWTLETPSESFWRVTMQVNNSKLSFRALLGRKLTFVPRDSPPSMPH